METLGDTLHIEVYLKSTIPNAKLILILCYNKITNVPQIDVFLMDLSTSLYHEVGKILSVKGNLPQLEHLIYTHSVTYSITNSNYSNHTEMIVQEFFRQCHKEININIIKFYGV